MSVDLISRKKTSNHLLSVRQSIKPLSTRSLSYITAILMSGAATLALGEAQALSIDFTDDYFFNQTGHYGSALVRDTTTPANNYDSNPYDLLTYTSPSLKMVMGPNGTLGFGAHNLLTHSGDYSNAIWTKSLVTITSAALPSPFGASLDALVSSNSTADQPFRVTQTVTTISGASYELSAIFKAGDVNFGRLLVTGGTTRAVWFNLSTGAVATQTNATGSITSLGDGFYLCAMSFISDGTTSVLIQGTAADGLFVATVTSGTTVIYAGRTHFRRTPVHTDTYLATTSAARYALPYEWDVNGDPLGLLVEEQRTNLCLRSQEFDNASWTFGFIGMSSPTVSGTNTVISPDGTTTAEVVSFSAVTGTTNISTIRQSIAVTAADYTGSVYVKANASGDIGKKIAIWINDGSIIANFTFHTLTSTWERIYVTQPVSASPAFISIGVVGSTYGGQNQDAVDVAIWGAQLELGSFPTSYIPTLGSTVTRALDIITLATSAFPHGAPRTIYVHTKYGGSTAISQFVMQLDDGTSNERDYIFWNGDPLTVRVVDGGVLLVNETSDSATLGSNYKVAYALETNDFAMVTNGGTPKVDATVTIPTVTTLRLGTPFALNGHIKQLMYLPRRASNEELQALTT